LKVLESNSPKGFIILEAQNDSELSYLNYLIRNGKAMASGDSYQILIQLKNGKTIEQFKDFLKAKGFKTI